MTVILKNGYTFCTYNTGELPCAEYVEQLVTPGGVTYKRSKGTFRDGKFPVSSEEFFRTECPEAFESVDDYEIINGGHPLYGDKTVGDCWVRIFRGYEFRAFLKSPLPSLRK